MKNNEPPLEIEKQLAISNNRYHRALLISVVVLGLLVLAGLLDLHVIAENNRRTLEILEQQTSPEAQKRTEERLSRAIDLIDCNNRDAIEDVIRGLEASGLLDPGSVEVINERCEELENGD